MDYHHRTVISCITLYSSSLRFPLHVKETSPGYRISKLWETTCFVLPICLPHTQYILVFNTTFHRQYHGIISRNQPVKAVQFSCACTVIKLKENAGPVVVLSIPTISLSNDFKQGDGHMCMPATSTLTKLRWTSSKWRNNYFQQLLLVTLKGCLLQGCELY